MRQPEMACSACIRSVAIIETPTIVKPSTSRGTQLRGKVQQSWPGWLRPVPRRAIALSMLNVGPTCSNSSRIAEMGTSGITCSCLASLM